jgi:methionyl-tRNA formyltransferase
MAHGADLAAVILAGNRKSLLAGTPDPPLDAASASGTELIDVPDRSTLSGHALRTRLEQIAPDLIVVACFPWRLPTWLLHLPPRGCLNVHPSLLPDGRGPEPVFWAFRWGLEESGVTLHVMDEGLDTGPVLSQRRVQIPDESTISSLERTLAETSAAMLMDHISGASERPNSPIPQAHAAGRYARFPRQDDLVVPTFWSARHAARFIHAVSPTYGPVPVLVLSTGQRLVVSKVLTVATDASSEHSVAMDGDTASIRFTDGTLVCQVVRNLQPIRLQLPTG